MLLIPKKQDNSPTNLLFLEELIEKLLSEKHTHTHTHTLIYI